MIEGPRLKATFVDLFILFCSKEVHSLLEKKRQGMDRLEHQDVSILNSTSKNTCSRHLSSFYATELDVFLLAAMMASS